MIRWSKYVILLLEIVHVRSSVENTTCVTKNEIINRTLILLEKSLEAIFLFLSSKIKENQIILKKLIYR
jgi:hypothetical protein